MPFPCGALRTLALAAFACAIAGFTPPFASVQTKFAAEVPLLDCDGTPCVDAQIGDGKTVRLGIDTGNVDSVVDSKVAEAAGLKPSEPPKAGAPSGMFRTVMTTVHVGALTLANVSAIGMDLSDMISQKQMPHVAGTLAYTAFKDRILQLDFVAHKLRVSDVLTGPVKCTGACDTMALVTFGKDGPPILVADGFEINGVKRVGAGGHHVYGFAAGLHRIDREAEFVGRGADDRHAIVSADRRWRKYEGRRSTTGRVPRNHIG